MKMRFKNITTTLITIIIISVVAVGCGSSNKSTIRDESTASQDVSQNNGGLNNNVLAKDEKTSQTSPMNSSGSLLQGQGKIIRTGTVKMETLNFDETIESILSKVNSIGAYVQSSNVSGRSIGTNLNEDRRQGEFILRIPKTKFDSFMLDIGNLGSITNQKISTEDVTSTYFDTQAHLKSLTIQEERLLELLKKTGELKDIIVLEKELTDVRYEIEGLTGSLKKWDNLIDFSTLNIEISEVHKIKEISISFGGKVANGFINSMKSLMVFGKEFIVVISTSIPYLVILFIISLIGRYVYKRIKSAK